MSLPRVEVVLLRPGLERDLLGFAVRALLRAF